ncbi:zinc ribbon domain-containing protein [Methanobacterium formicicum]|uniref:zinc ribbon domain-containing protein n=1 Tax=Methanobacterium formicicum TaxID=2162 RepID=UPI0024911A5A|nr:zinc ribbon domain-containing protein [Methanobacterium formicicum]
MFCKKCGYENDDDALYCENCGTNLSSINSPSSSGRRKTNKILMVAVVVLILGIGVIAGMMMISKAPVVNNTNVTNENQNTQSATQNTSNNGPEIIDSNSITGNSEIYGNFKFEWKTYKNTEYNLVIYSTFSNEVQNNLKQTGTLSMMNRVQFSLQLILKRLDVVTGHLLHLNKVIQQSKIFIGVISGINI